MTTLTRRTFTGATAAAVVASLTTACGRSEGGDADSKTAEAIGKGAATGELNVWAMGAEGEKLPALIKKFESENPDLKVNVTPIPWDSAHDKFTSAIAAGTAPDVAQVGSTYMAEFASLQALEPTPKEIDLGAFFPGAKSSVEVGGTAYGVPWYVETRVVYYRKDLAEKAGIAEPPTDWEGLHGLAQAYQDNGAKWGMSLQPGKTGSWQTVLPFVWSNGGAVVSDDGKTFTFDSKENVEALAYYQSFFKKGLANPAPADGTTETDFASGTVPMFISGPWMMSAVEAAGGDGFAERYGVFEMPTKQTSSSFLGGAHLGVFSGSKNRDAAWKLVQYLIKPDTQLEWFSQSTDMPAVESSWDDKALSGNEKFKTFHTQLGTARAAANISTWEQVAEKFDAQVELVCKQNLDPAEALKTVQAEAQSIGTGE